MCKIMQYEFLAKIFWMHFFGLGPLKYTARCQSFAICIQPLPHGGPPDVMHRHPVGLSTTSLMALQFWKMTAPHGHGSFAQVKTHGIHRKLGLFMDGFQVRSALTLNIPITLEHIGKIAVLRKLLDSCGHCSTPLLSMKSFKMWPSTLMPWTLDFSWMAPSLALQSSSSIAILDAWCRLQKRCWALTSSRRSTSKDIQAIPSTKWPTPWPSRQICRTLKHPPFHWTLQDFWPRMDHRYNGYGSMHVLIAILMPCLLCPESISMYCLDTSAFRHVHPWIGLLAMVKMIFSPRPLWHPTAPSAASMSDHSRVIQRALTHSSLDIFIMLSSSSLTWGCTSLDYKRHEAATTIWWPTCTSTSSVLQLFVDKGALNYGSERIPTLAGLARRHWSFLLRKPWSSMLHPTFSLSSSLAVRTTIWSLLLATPCTKAMTRMKNGLGGNTSTSFLLPTKTMDFSSFW